MCLSVAAAVVGAHKCHLKGFVRFVEREVEQLKYFELSSQVHIIREALC